MRILKQAGRVLKGIFDIDDVLVLGGAGLIAAGVWMIYVPAAYIVVGFSLLYLGLRGSRLRRRNG